MNTPELVGTCSYVWDVPDDYYYPDRLWKTILFEGNNPVFIWQCLQQPDVRKQIQNVATGTSGTMFNISKAKLLDVLVPDAEIDSQNAFASFIEKTESIRALLIRRKILYNEFFNNKMCEFFD